VVPLTQLAGFQQGFLPRPTNVSPKLRPLKVFGFSNLDVPNAFAGAFENSFRIVQRRAVIETEISALGIHRDVKNAVAEFVAWAIADRDRVVCVVDVFIARRNFIEQDGAQLQSEIPHLSIIRLKKFFERRGDRIFQAIEDQAVEVWRGPGRIRTAIERARSSYIRRPAPQNLIL